MGWQLVYNKGIAFGFFSTSSTIQWLALVLLSFVFMAYIAREIINSSYNHMASLGLCLIFGGALGNFLNRVFCGHVIDFIRLYGESWSFAIFNFADIAINIGLGLYLLDQVCSHYNTSKN